MIIIKQTPPKQQEIFVEKYKPKNIKGFNWLIKVLKKLFFEQITEFNTSYEEVNIDESDLKEFIFSYIKDINCDFGNIDYFIVGKQQFKDLSTEFQLNDIFRVGQRDDEYIVYGYRIVINPYINGVVPVLK